MRGEQHENQVARAAVNRVKIYALFEPCKGPDWMRQRLNAGMRDGDAFPNAGRAEILALYHSIKDIAAIKADFLANCMGELVENLLAAFARNGSKNDTLRKEACKIISHLFLTYRFSRWRNVQPDQPTRYSHLHGDPP